MQLRSHQSALMEAVRNKDSSDFPLSILAWVVPGGGKSWLPHIVYQRFPEMRVAWFVPRKALRQQACEDMMPKGLALRESDNLPDPCRGQRGFVATHQALTESPDLYLQEFQRFPYILVTDEIHHAKIFSDGSQNVLATALDRLAPLARVHLKMSGTLETNDNSTIWGCEYDQSTSGLIVAPERSANILVRYDRKTALAEKAIVPIEFRHYDGPTKFIADGDEQDIILSKAATRKEESQSLFTALQTELADGLLETGLTHWRRYGDRLIIVCATQQVSKHYASQLRKRGDRVALAVTDEGPDALEAIKQFKRGDCRILVTCAMAYEGLDCKPVTHIICLTHIRSVPWIEQMFARSWRALEGKSQCWAFVPDDPRMRRVIEAIRREQPSVIRLASDTTSGGGGGPGEPVVPIFSDVDTVRAQMLDGSVQGELLRADVVGEFRKFGLAENDPLIDQFISKILASRGSIPKPADPLTISDQEGRLRRGIHRMCCGADKRRGQDPGSHQKELCRRMGWRKVNQMTLLELERAAKLASELCA
jgi:superfamily II DNA or RNA helicase